MTDTTKRHSAAFKARVALEAVEADQDPRRAVRNFPGPLRPDQQMEEQLLDGIESPFRDGRRHGHDESQVIQAELYEQIGRLKMEVEWLKIFSSPFLLTSIAPD